MIRALALLVLTAIPVAAQDPEWPPFDASLIDTCLDNASISAEDQAVAPNYEACIGVAAATCQEQPGGYSTAGMSYCLGQELDVWDQLLNDSYGKIMKAAEATDAEMADLGSAAEKQVPLLRKMQRDWITFRDSKCAYERSRWGGGTGGGPAVAACMLQLTAQQYLAIHGYEPSDS